MSNELVFTKEIEGKEIPITTSRQVAEHFEKEHKNVKRDIRNLISEMGSKMSTSNYFVESDYKDNSNRTQVEYLLTRDGFTLLTMGFTGSKALEFKIKYINAFNQMEEQIKNLTPQISEKDKLLLNLFSDDPIVVSTSHKRLVALEVEEATTPLLETIEEQAPKVDKYEQFLETDGAITFENVAKIISTKASEDGECFSFSRITLPRYLREHNILVKTKKGSKYLNTPRKEYEKYFNVSLTTHNKYGEELPNPSLQTRVKPIGIDFIYDFVKENGAN